MQKAKKLSQKVLTKQKFNAILNLRKTQEATGGVKMYVVNVKKLKGKIVEKGFNNTTFSKALGIGRDTLRAYLNDYTKIPYEIISKMVDVL